MNFVNIPLAVAALVIGIVLGHAASASVPTNTTVAPASATPWASAHAAIPDDGTHSSAGRDRPAPEISSTF